MKKQPESSSSVAAPRDPIRAPLTVYLKRLFGMLSKLKAKATSTDPIPESIPAPLLADTFSLGSWLVETSILKILLVTDKIN